MLTVNGTVVTRTTSTPKIWKKAESEVITQHGRDCSEDGNCNCPRKKVIYDIDQFGRTFVRN